MLKKILLSMLLSTEDEHEVLFLAKKEKIRSVFADFTHFVMKVNN